MVVEVSLIVLANLTCLPQRPGCRRQIRSIGRFSNCNCQEWDIELLRRAMDNNVMILLD